MPRKKQTVNSPSPSQQDEYNYGLDFIQQLNNFNNAFLFNPFLMNQSLKNLNMQPASQPRERLQQMVDNPQNNEQPLRRFGQYLYFTQMIYKRMIHYLADILTFDWYPIAKGWDERDIQKPSFKRDFDIMCQWFENFDVKREFRKALLKMVQEDAYFTYLREDSDGDMFLQEMPIDYCTIDGIWKYGYIYSFDLMYFQQTGVDINGFAPEFKNFYRNLLDMKKNNTYSPNIKVEQRNGRWMYWQQLKPSKAWVFKFHDLFAGSVPPFLGIFLDFYDMPTLKEISKAKSELEAYKIIIGEIPRLNDNRSGNSKDNFAINPTTLNAFMQLVKTSVLNKYVDFKALPLERIEIYDFDKSPEKTDMVAKGLDNISSQTGLDKSLFNTTKPNVASLKLSKIVDQEFITRVYSQFANFCTYHVNLRTKKFKFKIVFEGTIHDAEDRKKQAKEDMALGLITPRIAANYGMTLKEIKTGMELMKWLKFNESLSPVQTSYTLSSKQVMEKNKGGNPGKNDDDLGESGIITRTQGSNELKEVD